MSEPIVIDEFVNELFAIFDNVFNEPLIVLFVSVSVVSLPTNVSVDVGKVIVPVFEIEEITGDVKVLFVSVCEPVTVATVLSISKVTVSFVTVEANPVPPAKVNVPPVVKVSSVELSSLKVNEPDGMVSNVKTPEPLVFKNCPVVPSVFGKVNVTSDARLFAAFNAT